MASRLIKETIRHTPSGSQTVLRCPSTHEAVEETTDRLSDMLVALPLSERERFELTLAIHEALANAAHHGNRDDPAKDVTVTWCCRPDRLLIAVDDEGEGFDPAAVPDCTAEENILRESGRGIFLIRRLADECHFENHGRRVVMIKHLR
ncbi:MAG: ATP-binding protein [Candidatus Brocadiia bacterium]